ncbi:capsular polysaccharide synthesis protein [Tatumella sp. UBA2305]|uniref:capsular polysaccharide synthesis protein n=1 Tax=Tatumella sp. UBA2305 TaxID=1947647 RepID=UPI0025EB110C|nr:capsular polysaccharide synthesis protein [Tatumella sp. UBA2305]
MIIIVKALRKLSFLIIKNVVFKRKINNLVHRVVETKVSKILEKEKVNFSVKKNVNVTMEKYVWILWLQGEENAPLLVKACIASIKKHVPEDYNVTVISENNISEFIELPAHIQKKYASGEITRTHFSDILRWALLATYGGLWMDSTIYLANKLSLENCNDLVTLKTPADEEDKYISRGRWCIFFIGVSDGYKPAKEMMNNLYRYWITENKLVDYFLVDYIFDSIVKSNSELRDDIESNSNYTGDMYFLQENLEREMTPLISERINYNKPGVFKMSYKASLSENQSPETVLSHLLTDKI